MEAAWDKTETCVWNIPVIPLFKVKQKKRKLKKIKRRGHSKAAAHTPSFSITYRNIRPLRIKSAPPSNFTPRAFHVPTSDAVDSWVLLNVFSGITVLWRVDGWLEGRHGWGPLVRVGPNAWTWGNPYNEKVGCVDEENGNCDLWVKKYPCRPLIIIHFDEMCCQMRPYMTSIYAYATAFFFFFFLNLTF